MLIFDEPFASALCLLRAFEVCLALVTGLPRGPGISDAVVELCDCMADFDGSGAVPDSTPVLEISKKGAAPARCAISFSPSFQCITSTSGQETVSSLARGSHILTLCLGSKVISIPPCFKSLSSLKCWGRELWINLTFHRASQTDSFNFHPRPVFPGDLGNAPGNRLCSVLTTAY